MKKVLWGLLLLLTSCNDQSQALSNIQISKELEPYFYELVEDIERNGVEIDLSQPIRIVLVEELPTGVIGLAHGMFNPNWVSIAISREYWDKFNEVEKRWVLLHEMGHDFWEVHHNGSGIMRPYHRVGDSLATFKRAAKEMYEDLKRVS